MSNRGSLNEDDSVSSSSSIPNLAEKLVLDENAPRARLCHLKKWPHFQGYGFNLHAERSRIGQHIGKVDPNSPAESAGLKEGDRIVEVNFVNISNENHQQVVKRIRTGLEIDGDLHEDEVVLLVVDSEADEYYKKLNIVVKHDFPNVLKLATSSSAKEEGELNQPTKEEDTEDVNEEDQEQQQQQQIEEPKRLVSIQNTSDSKLDRNDLANRSTSSTNYYETNSLSDASDTNNNNKPKEKHLSNSKQITNPSPVNSETDSNNNSLVNEKQRLMMPSYEKQQQPSPSNSNKLNSSPSSLSSASKDSSNVSSNQNKISTNKKSPLELKDDPFKMSAAEFRNYLKSKGRNDPRVDHVDMRVKHEIFQNM